MKKVNVLRFGSQAVYYMVKSKIIVRQRKKPLLYLAKTVKGRKSGATILLSYLRLAKFKMPGEGKYCNSDTVKVLM